MAKEKIMRLLHRNRKKASREPRWRFRRIMGAPRRLARRRGFGVHSPFAYDFIRRVISQPCAYYCYPQLRQLARAAGMRPAVQLLLFRVSLNFRPRHLVVEGADDAVRDAIIAAVAEGSPEVRTDGDGPADMTVVCGEVGESVALQCAEHGGVVVFTDKRRTSGLARNLWLSTARGMLFRGSRVAVYAGAPHLPHQLYNVWF